MNDGTCTVVRKIAQGGVADIYLAKARACSGVEKYLICKRIRRSFSEDSEFLSSMIREMACCEGLRHANIVEIFELCCACGQIFLTMEYMDAGDFSHLIIENNRRHDVMPYACAIYAVREAALGLHAAHELKDAFGTPLHLVHRDISPENILLNSDGEIKIGDFGIAKTLKMPDITPPDVIRGKFGYMSPEQAWGDKLDRRSDIFSLAAVLYEATTGKGIYPADSVETTLQCARVAMYALPHEVCPGYPQDLETILLKALDLDKNQRYATALEFARALEACAAAHQWACSRKAWLEYLRGRDVYPSVCLPRMQFEDMEKKPSGLCDLMEKWELGQMDLAAIVKHLEGSGRGLRFEMVNGDRENAKKNDGMGEPGNEGSGDQFVSARSMEQRGISSNCAKGSDVDGRACRNRCGISVAVIFVAIVIVVISIMIALCL